MSSTVQETNIIGLPASGATLFRGFCVTLRPRHAGWYQWWCSTQAPGGYACCPSLVSADAGRDFAGSCRGRGVHWGLGCWSFDTHNLVLLCAVALLNSLLSLENPKGLLDEIKID